MEKKDLKLIDKLIKIQQELKAPKNQFNSFGNYNYRSCEDILEAVKPLLNETQTILRLTDELVQIGERYYVKATAILTDGTEEVINTAFAREEETKKGMDGSQITGASSSYARKYALNGLFLIDDVKDSDTTNKGNEQQEEKKASPKQIDILSKYYTGDNLTKLLNSNNIENLEDMPMKRATELISVIMEKGSKNGTN